MSLRGESRPAVIGCLVAALALELMPLPGVLELLRPPWVTMVIVYWALMWPRVCGIGTAWAAGLVLDLMQGALLGQHAMVLALIGYITQRFHLQIRIFPLWQLTGAVAALLMIEAFLLWWIDGVAGLAGGGMARLLPVLTGGVLWPLVMALLDRVREHMQASDSRFA